MDADAMGSRRRVTLIVLLGALTTVAPLSIDMYVPGFPQMRASLDASDAAVQLSMTGFLAGLVAGQLVVGPISDKVGRRTPLLLGMALFAVLSLACAAAPDVAVLIAVRFLQGAAAAAGMTLARAIVTDHFHGPRLPRYFSMLSVILGVAPILAPVLGAGILSVWTWRAVFVLLAAVGVVLFVAVLSGVPESLPPRRRQPGGVAARFASMGTLARHRAFLGCTLTLAFAAATLFAYIASSAFVFQDVYGTSTTTYSLIFATNAIGMLTASAIFGALSQRLPIGTLLSGFVAFAVVAATVHMVGLIVFGGRLALTWICLFFAVAAIGGIFPASMSLGQMLGHRTSGAASALLGSTQYLFGALAAPIAGAFGVHSAVPMAGVMLVALAGAAVSLVVLIRPRRGMPEPVPVPDVSPAERASRRVGT